MMDAEEYKLKQLLERARETLVWGRRQRELSGTEMDRLYEKVTDAEIKLFEYRRMLRDAATSATL